jgi:hypothetical protein
VIDQLTTLKKSYPETNEGSVRIQPIERVYHQKQVGAGQAVLSEL